MPAALWWIRRDLRLDDNQALQSACAAGKRVIPVFIMDPGLKLKPADKRQAFLNEGLASLDQELRKRKTHLILRQGDPVEELSRLLAETGAERVYTEEDYSPDTSQQDTAAARSLPLTFVTGMVVHPPDQVCKRDGSAYKVFTPFFKAWNELPFSRQSQSQVPVFLQPDKNISSLPVPLSVGVGEFPATEAEAQRRLAAFLSGPVFEYDIGRDRLDWNGTSSLSPYLRFGLISARKVVAAARLAIEAAPDADARLGAETWLKELAWREFYFNILFHFPNVLHEAFNPALRAIPWRDAPSDLRAWQAGMTGFPVVDACMRQLSGLGWMHNRGRMITASFLVKDLLIDWRLGETWFMRNLVDGDPGANNGGWQWTSGVGTDAAPYFRILNPVAQSQKWDPRGNFIRRWIPELAKVPPEFIHEPWLMPADLQQSITCRIGRDYPAPVVNHQSAKERVIPLYKMTSSAYRSKEKE